MKITKKQLKQIIKEEISKVLGENENIDYFAVVSPDGKVFKISKGLGENDPQKAINLAAARTAPAYKFGDFKVYEYAQYGGGVRKNTICVGPPEEEMTKLSEVGFRGAPAGSPEGMGDESEQSLALIHI